MWVEFVFNVLVVYYVVSNVIGSKFVIFGVVRFDVEVVNVDKSGECIGNECVGS